MIPLAENAWQLEMQHQIGALKTEIEDIKVCLKNVLETLRVLSSRTSLANERSRETSRDFPPPSEYEGSQGTSCARDGYKFCEHCGLYWQPDKTCCNKCGGKLKMLLSE